MHGTNIALRKSARLSSVQSAAVASRAVDGHTDGNYWSTFSCSHSVRGYGEWWDVDLFGFYQIEKVVVYNRVDCCSE